MTSGDGVAAQGSDLGGWVVFEQGRVVARTGKVELGQGIVTALHQIVAEELGVDAGRVEMVATRTDLSPFEGFTSGSMSVAESGASLRRVCQGFRSALLDATSIEHGLRAEHLRLVDGTVLGPDGRRLSSYWGTPGDDEPPPDRPATGSAGEIPAGLMGRVVLPGSDLARTDLPDKVLGRPRFIHDLVLPGMVHGRVVRPPSRGAMLDSVDEAEVVRLPGVLEVVRDGNFLGVIASDELLCERAATRLVAVAKWSVSPTLPDQTKLAQWLVEQPSRSTSLEEGEAARDEACTYRATYFRPLLAHGSIGPSCGIAQDDGEWLSVWSHSQGVFALRDALASALGRAPNSVVVRHVEGAGCYGHNPADDAAADAALLACARPGPPVRVQWTRSDELSWDAFGSAMVAEVRAGVSAGKVTDWAYDVWSNGHTARPGYAGVPGLLGASHRCGEPSVPAAVDPSAARGHGSGRNADPAYDFARRSITSHLVSSMPLRTSALRSLGAFLNVFAIESSMDDLAHEQGTDPVEFRLTHLRDPRARAVVELAAERGDWGAARPENIGRGFAYARYKNRGAYCAVVAEVEAESSLVVRRLVVAVDVGRVVNADGVRNQIEGGAIQATSWTLKERVTFDERDVTSTNWESYPILRFSEVPYVEVHLLDRPELPSVGAGEAVQGPVPGAVANALFDALGVRVRTLPLDRASIVAAIEG